MHNPKSYSGFIFYQCKITSQLVCPAVMFLYICGCKMCYCLQSDIVALFAQFYRFFFVNRQVFKFYKNEKIYLDTAQSGFALTICPK